MYDYIIVGAGSAGATLASRLSEDPELNVLLLEAGGVDDDPNIHTPAGFGALYGSAFDWAYRTEEEPGLNNRKIYEPRGRGLGGCSSTNAMVYIRGNVVDYDEWRDAGNSGWGWSDMLPAFKRSEGNERGESEFHGGTGPLSVSDGRSRNPMMQAVVQGGIEVGLPANDDFNGLHQDGVGHYQVTQRNGCRCSTAVAFLRPAERRPNLEVRTGTQVRRVLFDGRRATAVEVEVDGTVTELSAEREILLSAGAYNSPKLLLLSGVGPRADLEALGIDVVCDSPGVGRNLQDHPLVALCWTSSQPISLLAAADEEQVKLYTEERRGMLASNVAESGAFARSREDLLAPDVQLIATPVLFVDEGLIPPTEHGFTITAGILKPESRGRVTLRSADPSDPPVIEHNYLTHEDDRVAMRFAVRLALKVGESEALDEFRAEAFQLPASSSDEDVDAFVQSYAQPIYHAAGSCAMGSGSDAVVSDTLAVHGVEGLRVIDASIMPKIVRGNTNAPVIAIAERAVELVLSTTESGRQAATLT